MALEPSSWRAAVLVLALGSPSFGDPPLSRVPRALPLPVGVRTIVPSDGAAVFAQPDAQSRRVGSLAGVRVLFQRSSPAGGGCRALWFELGPQLWFCGAEASLSAEPGASAENPLGWSYGLTTTPSLFWRTREEALDGRRETAVPLAPWQGFAIRARHRAGQMRVVETHSGRFVPAQDVRSASRSLFHGQRVSDVTRDAPDALPGWVIRSVAHGYPTPEMAARSSRRGDLLRRLSFVRVFEARTALGHDVVRIDSGRWVRASSLRVFSPASPPPEVNVGARERWIDIDLSRQIVSAYEGNQPVYVTLTSTGEPESPTVTGVFRVWLKRLAQPMGLRAVHRHILEEVPYVQYFDHDRALHGVYWHHEFGQPRSHGCVNLAFSDAAFLFEFTAPTLPLGFRSLLTPAGEGTVVRVRGTTPLAPTARRGHRGHRRH